MRGPEIHSPFLTTSATANRLVLLMGRMGSRRTTSPREALPSASWAWYRVVELWGGREKEKEVRSAAAASRLGGGGRGVCG